MKFRSSLLAVSIICMLHPVGCGIGQPVSVEHLNQQPPVSSKLVLEVKRQQDKNVEKELAGMPEMIDLESSEYESCILCTLAMPAGGLSPSTLTKLQQLHITVACGINVTDQGLQDLAHLDTLENISLNDGVFTPIGLKALERLRELKALFLFREEFSDDYAGVIAGMRGLDLVCIDSSQVNRQQKERIKLSLPKTVTIFHGDDLAIVPHKSNASCIALFGRFE